MGCSGLWAEQGQKEVAALQPARQEYLEHRSLPHPGQRRPGGCGAGTGYGRAQSYCSHFTMT